jgi:hypothetical protein
MSTKLDEAYLAPATWTSVRDDDSRRWPPFASFCFAVGTSALLWLSIIELLGALR